MEDKCIIDCMKVGLSHKGYTFSANERIAKTLAHLLEKQTSDTEILIHLPNTTLKL